MKIIRPLSGSSSSAVSLVAIDNHEYVLKTADIVEIENEHEFNRHLHLHNIPTLETFQNSNLQSNQILLEYIPDSPTLGGHLTPQRCYQWGVLMSQLHAIQAPHASYFDSALHTIPWSDFISNEIHARYKKDKPAKIPQELLLQIIAPLISQKHDSYSLLHGDCHSNNVLIRNNDLVLFDKASEILFGDPAYDLAIIALEFPNDRYAILDATGHTQDSIHLHAFIQGYGRDFTQDPHFDLYVLLRAIIREPNSFQPHLSSIIDELVKKFI